MRDGRRPRRLAAAGLVVGLAVTGAAGPPAAGAELLPMPGLARYAASSPAGDPEVAVVTCPISHFVYGLGAEVHNGLGRVHIVSMLPNATLTSVTVVAAPRMVVSSTWWLTAYAICGPPQPVLPHRELSLAASWVDVEPCDVASRLYGTGARHGGHPAQTLREMIPNAPLAPPTTARASVNPPAGAPGVTAAAICGAPLPTLHSVAAPAPGLGSTVSCPFGELVHGTGGLIPGVNPDIVFEAIVPNPALTSVRVSARNGATLLAEPTRAFAVCA